MKHIKKHPINDKAQVKSIIDNFKDVIKIEIDGIRY